MADDGDLSVFTRFYRRVGGANRGFVIDCGNQDILGGVFAKECLDSLHSRFFVTAAIQVMHAFLWKRAALAFEPTPRSDQSALHGASGGRRFQQQPGRRPCRASI